MGCFQKVPSPAPSPTHTHTHSNSPGMCSLVALSKHSCCDCNLPRGFTVTPTVWQLTWEGWRGDSKRHRFLRVEGGQWEQARAAYRVHLGGQSLCFTRRKGRRGRCQRVTEGVWGPGDLRRKPEHLHRGVIKAMQGLGEMAPSVKLFPCKLKDLRTARPQPPEST